jgi:hypothetical protein
VIIIAVTIGRVYVGASHVSWGTEPRERGREFFSFAFFRSRLCANLNCRLIHLLAFAAIIAQNRQNLVLNHLSHLQSRRARDLLQSYLNVQSISMNFFSFPDPVLEPNLPHSLIGQRTAVLNGVLHSCHTQIQELSLQFSADDISCIKVSFKISLFRI